jgi:protein phosphatase
MNWTHLVQLAKSLSLPGQAATTSENPQWIGTGLSHTGRVRSSNQDAFGIDNRLGLWVVADGMGGQAGGNVASELAVAAVFNYVREHASASHAGHEERLMLLTEAIKAAHTALIDRVNQLSDLKGMGTTIVGVFLSQAPQPAFAVAHVGDSRAYLIRDRQIRALTRDHSLVEQLIDEGEITRRQARTHPRQNVLLKALGPGYQSIPDGQVLMLKPQDKLFLCTDGVTKMVSELEILSAILKPNTTAEDICQRIIAKANENGGVDNSTVLFITPQIQT